MKITKFIKNLEFDLIEIRDIVISLLVLSFIFSYRRVFIEGNYFSFFESIFILIFVFLFHELAHRTVARKYECKAKYVMWPTGILISILFTLFTDGLVIFAAIGFVSISYKYPTRLGFKFVGLTLEEIGWISLSGPLTNIIVALIFKTISPLNPSFFMSISQISLVLALFNLFPIPPLDGSKVFAWSRVAWICSMTLSFVLFITIPFIGILESIILTIATLITIFFLSQKIA